MPSEPNDGDGSTMDHEESTDERRPEERARAAADAIETIGADRLTDLIIEAWEQGGLPPFDDGADENDESNGAADRTDSADDSPAR